MQKTLAEIAELIKGEIIGDRNLIITGFCGIKEAREGDLTFLANSKYAHLLETTKASAIITPPEVRVSGKSIIRIDNPSLAFANMVEHFIKDAKPSFTGIHKTAVIAEDAVIGKNVTVGAYSVIESRVKIGDNTIVYPGCFIGHHTTIGQNCLLYPQVIIREKVSIGHRVIIHSGTVIGSDGFGFVNVQGAHKKIPQIGTVVVEDDVEIGANVTIDRARFDKTFIGRGTKIDNLVQIGHNVIIGENCIIVAQSGISGSVEIKKGAVLAGQSGISGHLTIGENSVVGAQSGVSKSIPPNTTVWGFPAKPIDEAKRVNAAVQRLPIYVKAIRDLQKRIEELEKKIK